MSLFFGGSHNNCTHLEVVGDDDMTWPVLLIHWNWKLWMKESWRPVISWPWIVLAGGNIWTWRSSFHFVELKQIHFFGLLPKNTFVYLLLKCFGALTIWTWEIFSFIFAFLYLKRNNLWKIYCGCSKKFQIKHNVQ